ncbi:MAG TPA: glycosyltransferase family 4 protein [Vicinamibacterales bacterium]|nr:glycosyltransferase family 4 protein [Vicinamibacterales bacterium]
MHRPKLLFLCQTLPYPADGGVWIRTYHVLRLLSRAFDVTALCFERAGSSGDSTDWATAAGPDALGRFAHVEVFPIPQKRSRVRFAWDHLRSVASGRVYTTYLYESKRFRARLRQLLRSTAFDLVHVDSLDLAAYLPACGQTPVVCVHHDIESTLLGRRAALDRHRWRGAYLRYQAGLMADVERRWCGRIALNVTVSEQDQAVLKRAVPDARVCVVPNGVDPDEFRPVPDEGRGVAFVGGTSPFPNLDALDYFCSDIAPHLFLPAKGAPELGVASGFSRKDEPIPIRWIGRASDEQRQHYRSRFDVELTGYVDDVRTAMAEAACHIVPLRIGGGTRLKILNAWAMGKPVVSTSVGCEGLHAIDGDNILIRDDPRAFAGAALAVLQDDGLRKRLGARGRETVARLYSWEAIASPMIDAYLAAARAPRVPAPPDRSGTADLRSQVATG